MKVLATKKFQKKVAKLPIKIQSSLKTRLEIFIKEKFDVRLNNHRLHGSLLKYRSINITADYRLIYEELNDTTALLIDINTHSELYS